MPWPIPYHQYCVMAGPPMNDPAFLIVTGQSTLLMKYLFTAFFTVLVYDHLLTLSDEVTTIWRGRQSIVTCIFYFNRYYFIIAISIACIDVYYPLSKAACLKWGLLEPLGLTMPAILSAGFLMSLRIFAIWGKNKIILGVLLVYILAQCSLGMFTFLAPGRTSVPVPLPLDAFRVCAPIPTDARAKKTSPAFLFMQVAFDAVVVVLTIIPTLKHSFKSGRLRTFARDGVLYFAANFAVTLTWAIMKEKMDKPYQNVFALPSTITFICMANRITMSLRAPPDEYGSTAWESKPIEYAPNKGWKQGTPTRSASRSFDTRPTPQSTELSTLSTTTYHGA